MRYIADLHIHSAYSRATSSALTLDNLWLWAQKKGVQLIGTGDCIHPGWLDNIESTLRPADDGFLELDPAKAAAVGRQVPAACAGPVRFVLTTEISSIYKRGGAVRKVHNVICLSGIDAARRLQARLETIGNIRSDGRPILGLDSRDLLEIVLEIDPGSLLIPAHIWTPWFSVLGSKSGFNSIEECFGDLSKHVYAVETGLSSDPPMNWRLSSLDPYLLVSCSDAHSPEKLGREATVFETDFTYDAFRRALTDRGDRGHAGTIEFFPEEGKYHLDGHRKCEVRLEPTETKKLGGACPVCGKPVTVGVMARVEELADRPAGAKAANWRPYRSCIPLAEIVAEALGAGSGSKGVVQVLERVAGTLGSEFSVLLDVPESDIRPVAGELVAEGIRRMRAGTVEIAAGYDGDFGVIKLFTEEERSSAVPFRGARSAGSAVQEGLFGDANGAAAARPGRPRKTPSAGTRVGEPAPPHPAEAPVKAEAARVTVPHDPRPQANQQSPSSILNLSQLLAVNYSGGHALIIAGPGTGKTHTLTHRIARSVMALGEGERILAITFTNRAAEEMEERLTRLLGEKRERVLAGTFHAFCLRLLREHAAERGSTAPLAVVSREEIDAYLPVIWPEASAGQRKECLDSLSAWMQGAAQTPPPCAQAYLSFMQSRGLVDFDGLLRQAWELLSTAEEVRSAVRRTFRFVFVDEYQDINDVQHGLLKELVGDGVLLTAIGDPNQAIYGFRGASNRYFEQFAEDFPGARLFHLAENYRTGSTILNACGQVIAAIDTAGLPGLLPRFHREGRLVICDLATESAEAQYVVHRIEQLVGGTSMFSHDSGRVESFAQAGFGFGDIGVLYRTNAQARPLQEALDQAGIPYQVADAGVSQDALVGDALTLLRLQAGQSVTTAAASRLAGRLLGGTGTQFAADFADRMAGRGSVCIGDLRAELQMLALAGDAAAAGALALTGDLLPGDRGSSSAAALEAVSALHQFGDVLARGTPCHEQWLRLGRIALLYPELTSFLDHLALRRGDDAIECAVERVSLLTLHAAKGLEFSVVFIVGCEEGLIPLARNGEVDDPAEERRLFYVGMTRAKELLHITRSRRRTLYGRSCQPAPSPFLVDIREELKSYDAVRDRPQRRKVLADAEQVSLFGDGV